MKLPKELKEKQKAFLLHCHIKKIPIADLDLQKLVIIGRTF